jgi:hypothetical protein
MSDLTEALEFGPTDVTCDTMAPRKYRGIAR